MSEKLMEAYVRLGKALTEEDEREQVVALVGLMASLPEYLYEACAEMERIRRFEQVRKEVALQLPKKVVPIKPKGDYPHGGVSEPLLLGASVGFIPRSPELWVNLGPDYEEPNDEQVAALEKKFMDKYKGGSIHTKRTSDPIEIDDDGLPVKHFLRALLDDTCKPRTACGKVATWNSTVSHQEATCWDCKRVMSKMLCDTMKSGPMAADMTPAEIGNTIHTAYGASCPSGHDEKRVNGPCRNDYCSCQCPACRHDCGKALP